MFYRSLSAALALLLTLACAGAAPPGPWHGQASFIATLSGDSPTAATDGPILAARLRDQGVQVSVSELSPTSLKLEVSEAHSAEVLTHVLPRYQLEIASPNGTLRNDGVKRATQSTTEYSPDPVVEISLTDEGAKTFCEMTRASIRKPIEIKVDGRVLSAPVVMEAICGGRVTITMGHRSDAAANLAEARALATGLNSDPLRATWKLETIDAG